MPRRDREQSRIARLSKRSRKSFKNVRTRVLKSGRRSIAADYNFNVFINCPFDDLYFPMLRALTFAVFECGLRPRCALEVYDAGEVRIEKIVRIIRDCRWGIHDISRTDLNPHGLPRFNMPLELGLFLGARRFGAEEQRRKSCLFLDRDRHRYREFISDIAGQDVSAHGDDLEQAIKAVRDWLSVARAGTIPAPGKAAILKRHRRFMADLPAICSATDRDMADLTFTEYADIASTWLQREFAGPAGI